MISKSYIRSQISNALKRIIHLMFVIQLSLFGSSSILFGSDITHTEYHCEKDWVYLVMPHLGYCAASSFSDLYCFEGLSQTELKKLAESLKLSSGAKHRFDNRTVVSFSYVPAEQTFTVKLTSGNLSLSEGKYELSFLFDDVNVISINGYVMEDNPNIDPFIETPQSQILRVEHKQFLRDVVPAMKKYKRLQVKVSGVGAIPNVSLMGFSKAYNDMRQCMGEAVTFNLKDPF